MSLNSAWFQDIDKEIHELRDDYSIIKNKDIGLSFQTGNFQHTL